jgi:hypothetical protein
MARYQTQTAEAEPGISAARTGLFDKKNPVFRAMLISAIVITAARIAAPYDVGHDEGQQLEAAHRLAAGLGVTSTNSLPDSYDITKDPPPKVITWWPPGYSVLVGAFLAAGLPLLVTLKVIKTAVMLAGWAGWAVLAGNCLRKPIIVRGRSYPLHIVATVLLPAFFSPVWDGTDLFLWASVPWIVLLLLTSRSALIQPAIAGMLFGMVSTFRYASLFLGPGAALIILWQSYPNTRTFLRRFGIFACASLVFFVPLAGYLTYFNHSPDGLPGLLPEEELAQPIGTTVKWILLSTSTASMLILASPLARQALLALDNEAVLAVAGGLTILLVATLPFLLLRLRSKSADLGIDIALCGSFLGFSLLSVLCATSKGLFLSIPRYYEPLAFFGVFTAYWVLTSEDSNWKLKAAAAAAFSVFALHVFVLLPWLMARPQSRWQVTKRVLSYTPAAQTALMSTSHPVSYPSFSIYSRKESSRRKVQELRRQNPRALVFAENYSYFTYDGESAVSGPGKRLFRPLPEAGYWNRAYTSEALKVYWVMQRGSGLDFIPPAERTLVWADDFEKTEIFESSFPAGHRFGE